MARPPPRLVALALALAACAPARASALAGGFEAAAAAFPGRTMAVMADVGAPNGAVPMGDGLMNYVQAQTLAATDPDGRTAYVLVSDFLRQGQTVLAAVDVATGRHLASVDVPVKSVVFVGMGQRIGFDAKNNRVLVSGLVQHGERRFEHAFYAIEHGADKATDLGFTLESVLGPSQVQLGLLDLLGASLGTYDSGSGTFWTLNARNRTATKKPELFLVGVDVAAKRAGAVVAYPNDRSDCAALTGLFFDTAAGVLYALTFNMKWELSVGTIDPKTGICKVMHPVSPMHGLDSTAAIDSKSNSIVILATPPNATTGALKQAPHSSIGARIAGATRRGANGAYVDVAAFAPWVLQAARARAVDGAPFPPGASAPEPVFTPYTLDLASGHLAPRAGFAHYRCAMPACPFNLYP